MSVLEQEDQQQIIVIKLDARRIKNAKIPVDSFSRLILNPLGVRSLRRQNKHEYFSQRA
jgi:hypothetical protein